MLIGFISVRSSFYTLIFGVEIYYTYYFKCLFRALSCYAIVNFSGLFGDYLIPGEALSLLITLEKTTFFYNFNGLAGVTGKLTSTPTSSSVAPIGLLKYLLESCLPCDT